MGRLSSEDRGPIALAEKILTLLDEGVFTATYKYAVLLALLDLCMEKTTTEGAPPEMITTRELAEKIVEIYWPHATPFHTDGLVKPAVLLQSRTGRSTQAVIVSAIERFRREVAGDPTVPLARARLEAPAKFVRLVKRVEWKLIQMPLPRLQYLGKVHDEFLYSIGWDRSVRKSDVTQYQRDGSGPFDNRILLRPRVGEYLVLLNGLLRPLIHRQWAAMVARMNEMEESRLEEFLFGARRIPLEPVRYGLQELQGDRCFYCDRPLRRSEGWRPHVDHFVPWARYPNNAIENLVVAHERCNNSKREFLAASDHVARWRERFGEGDADAAGDELAEIAGAARWEADADRSLSVARAIYLHLPRDARLWLRPDEFEAADPDGLEAVLA